MRISTWFKRRKYSSPLERYSCPGSAFFHLSSWRWLAHKKRLTVVNKYSVLNYIKQEKNVPNWNRTAKLNWKSSISDKAKIFTAKRWKFSYHSLKRISHHLMSHWITAVQIKTIIRAIRLDDNKSMQFRSNIYFKKMLV